MNIDHCENILKSLLQKNVKLYLNNKIYKEGKILIYHIGCYSIELIIQNLLGKRKTLDIPLPFFIETCNNLCYFDYRFEKISYSNNMLQKILKMSKNSNSRFCNKILKMEILNEV